MTRAQTANDRQPKLLDQVRHKARLLHLAWRTENAYVQWIERFLRFHHDRGGQCRHPSEMRNEEIDIFLTYLAVDRHVAASTQDQTLSAIRCASATNDLSSPICSKS